MNPGLDVVNFGNELNNFSAKVLAPGSLPLDGTSSLHFSLDQQGEPTVGPASPTNFAGETGSIAVPILPESVGGVKAQYDDEER